MVAAAWGALQMQILVSCLIEAMRQSRRCGTNSRRFGQTSGRDVSSLAINKMTALDAPFCGCRQEMTDVINFVGNLHILSRALGHWCRYLRHWLAAELPESPLVYPEDSERRPAMR